MDHPAPAAPQRRVATLYAIFLVSGFCGLIYESIWSHYLKLLLGHAAYAQAVVLVVFVGGLAIGAWLAGRFSERIRNPILWYAAAEAVVGLMAFSFQGVFERASAWATSSFLPAMCGGPGACSASWLLAAALILPASILLGTTFPLMSAGVMRLGVQPGRGLSLLYFLNSLGAAVGVLASGFLLIPSLGLPGTLLLVGSCNVLVALAAYLTVRDTDTSQQALATVPVPTGEGGPSLLRLLLAVAAITGLSSFIYEVVWIRMLTLVLGAATHAFELMLAPFIFGLAVGAWWIRNRIESSRDAMLLLAKIQIVMGLLAIATLPLYAMCFDAMAWALGALARSESGYALFNLTSLTLAAAVMLPATICAGMTLPLVTAILLKRGYGERQVGQVYGINTLGAIAGVLLSVHFLIPVLGLKWSLAAGAAIDVVLGLLLWRAAQRGAPAAAASRTWWNWQSAGALAVGGAGALAAVAVVTFAAPIGPERFASGVFRHGNSRVVDGYKILFHQDGKTATVTVLETQVGVRSLLTNGKSDGATHPAGKIVTGDDHTMVLLGALGPLHHPTAKRAAVIGLGTGTTTAVLLGAPGLQQVDTIEIEPMMVEAAQLFRPATDAVYTDPRSQVIIDDARAHFSKVAARYDLVISEPSNPWVSGVAGLFTVEFYRHVSAHLAQDGHFVQWLQLYEASPELAASIVRAMTTVFPEVRAYATNNGDVALVARNDGQPPRLHLDALASMPEMQKHLRRLEIANADVLAAHDTGSGQALKLLARSYGSPPNSDFFPYVDTVGAQDRFMGKRATALFNLHAAPVPFFDFATGAPSHAGKVEAASVQMPEHVINAASSVQGLRFLQGEKLTPDQSSYLGSRIGSYTLLRAWMQDCRFPEDTGGLWPTLVYVAADLNPGLDAQRAAGFWRSLLDGRCKAAFTPAQRNWLELFAAVGARKPDAVRVLAKQVLEQEGDLDTYGRAYVALAGVSAELALGNRADAARLLVAQRAKLPESHMETPWFRYMVGAVTAREPATAP